MLRSFVASFLRRCFVASPQFVRSFNDCFVRSFVVASSMLRRCFRCLEFVVELEVRSLPLAAVRPSARRLGGSVVVVGRWLLVVGSAFVYFANITTKRSA